MSKALHADLQKAVKQMLQRLTIEGQVIIAEIISKRFGRLVWQGDALREQKGLRSEW